MTNAAKHASPIGVLGVVGISFLVSLSPKASASEQITYTSADKPLEQGAWRYALKRNDRPVTCRAHEESLCLTNLIEVQNLSGHMLECRASIRYDGLNSESFPMVDKPAVLLPRETRSVISDRAKPEVTIAEHEVACAPRPPIDRSRLTPGCKANFDAAKIDLAEAYPPTSRRAAEEGPVILEYSLSRKKGPPKDVHVVGSSLYPRLDQAAIEAFSRGRGSADCESGRFLFRLDFKLHD